MSRVKLNRRSFLRAGSALIALPAFESLLPEAAAQAAPPARLLIMKFPNGVFADSWRPIVAGASFNFPDQLLSLNPYKADITMPYLLANTAVQKYLTTGYHSLAAACFLTCSQVNNQPVSAGISIDRLLAERLGATATPSWLVTGANRPFDFAGEVNQFGSVLGSNISWINSTTPSSRLVDPRVVFDTLFPGASTNAPTVEQKLARYRTSILDSAIAQTTLLNNAMSAGDKQKLDQYLTGLREVEKSITAVPRPTSCQPFAVPAATTDFAQFTRTMIDLHVLGLQCGRSQIATHFLDCEASNRAGIAGNAGGHHDISHVADNPNFPNQWRSITKWYAEQLAYLLSKMKAAPSEIAGKSLLDVSLVVYGSDLHDDGIAGGVHGSTRLPIIVAGKANGALVGGRAVSTVAPLANLWVSIAQKLGVQINSFGDSTGPLAGL